MNYNGSSFELYNLSQGLSGATSSASWQSHGRSSSHYKQNKINKRIPNPTQKEGTQSPIQHFMHSVENWKGDLRWDF